MEENRKTPTPEASDPGPETVGADVAEEGAGPDLSRMGSVLESLLLVSSQPLSFEKAGRILGGLSRAEVRRVVEALRMKYPPDASGIILEEVAKGIQLRTNPANQEYVRRLFDVKPPRFTRPSLETLAVIAYKQPVTRAEMEQIRGVDCAGALKTLMERRLVKVVGKKDVAGRPFLFGTTREFLEVFGLSGLSDLPSMRDIEDFLAAAGGGIVPDEVPAGAHAEGGARADAPTELEEGLGLAEHGEPLVSTAPELFAGVSDDVLAEAASKEAGADAELETVPSSGVGRSRYAVAADLLESEPDAEPLAVAKPAHPEGISHEAREPGEGKGEGEPDAE